MYDKDKGIIFVDKNGKATNDLRIKKTRPAARAPVAPVPSPSPAVKRTPQSPRGDEADILIGKQKDPPELYFKSGLQYFKNGDYLNALKNFAYARSADPKPEYYLWIGKTYRQLDQADKMLATMDEILKKFRDSDVADDALFEVAVYYQANDDFENAEQKYAQLAEQYPFGISYADGEPYLDLSRKQRRLMRAEMVSALKILGFEGKTINDAYKAFQVKNGLSATGLPTKETVRMIKAKYDQKLKLDAQDAANEESSRQGVIVAVVAAFALGLNLWVLGVIRGKTRQRARHLENLKGMLAELDTRKL